MKRDHIFLLAVAVIWGSTIPLSKELFTKMTPVEFLLARYAFAFVPAALLWLWTAVKRRTGTSTGSQLVVAGILAVALALHTAGIDLTTSAFAGLTLALVPVLVALIEAAVFGKRFGPIAVGAILLSIASGLILYRSASVKWGLGEVCCFAGSLGIALFYVVVSRQSAKLELSQTILLQVTLCMTVFSVWLLASGGLRVVRAHISALQSSDLWTLAYCGVIASFAAYYIQLHAQRRLTPFVTALILGFEPLTAITMGSIYLKEHIDLWFVIASILALAAWLTASLDEKRSASGTELEI